MAILPRLHMFELEDLAWFPVAIRDLATDYLEFVQNKFQIHGPMLPPLKTVVERGNVRRIIDLCSGGGGPVVALARRLRDDGIDVEITLTDRYPNLEAFAHCRDRGGGAIAFDTRSIDARAVPPDLAGCRTLFNAFHHFGENDAVAILQDAVEAREPIGVFEVPERRVAVLLPFLVLTPFVVWLTTPFIRPFRWRRLVWTYLIPAVPMTCWWDGWVSIMRAYTAPELLEMTRRLSGSAYVWEAGSAPVPGTHGRVTYLIGYPKP